MAVIDTPALVTADALALIQHCRSQDVLLSRDMDGKLRLSSRRGPVDPVLREAVVAKRDDILTLLAAEEQECEIAVLPRRKAPLSPYQEGLWALHRGASSDLGALHVLAVFAIDGPLDRAALVRAVDRLVERQESLRLRIAPDPSGRPVASATPAEPGILSFEELPETMDDETLAAEAAAHAADLGAAPFDLSGEAPLRIRLMAAGAERHRLILVVHHIVADGWSVGVIMEDLSRLYAAEIGTGEAPPPLPFQALDHAAWLWEREQAEERVQGAEAWRKRLSGLPLLHPLAIDGDRERVGSSGAGRVRFRLPVSTVDTIAELARRERATTFMVLHAAFQALMLRLTGDGRLAVTTPVANRGRLPELEGLVTCLANTVILAGTADPRWSFRAAVAASRSLCLAAFADEVTPLDAVVEAVNPPRLPGTAPLAQIFFALQNAPLPLSLHGARVTVESRPSASSRYDLMIQFRDLPEGGIDAEIDYDAALFDEERITRLAEAYQRLLSAALTAPDDTLAGLSFVEPTAPPPAEDGAAPTADAPCRGSLEIEQLARRLSAAAPPGTAIAWIGSTDSKRLKVAAAADRAGLALISLPFGTPDDIAGAALVEAGVEFAILPSDLGGATDSPTPSWANHLTRLPQGADATLPDHCIAPRFVLGSGGRVSRIDPDGRRDRRRQAQAALRPLLSGLAPSLPVLVNLDEAGEDAFDLIEYLAASGRALLFDGDRKPVAGVGLALISNPARAEVPAERTILVNAIEEGYGSILGLPETGPLLAADAPLPGVAFLTARRLDPSLRILDAWGAPADRAGLGRLVSEKETSQPASFHPIVRAGDGDTVLVPRNGIVADAPFLWLSGRALPVDLAEARLLRLPGIADAAICLREAEGRSELVAFVVASGAEGGARLSDRVRSVLGGVPEIEHVVLLDALPRCRDGAVDRPALALLPLVSLTTARRLAAGGASAELTPARRRPRRLHIRDLVPDRSEEGLRPKPDYAPIGIDAVVASAVESDLTPAVVQGAPLAASYPSCGWSPADLLRDAAIPGRELIVGDDPVAERRIPYGALLDRATRIAGGLRKAGLDQGSVVLLSPRRPDDMIAALSGAMMAGVAVAPILPPRHWAQDDPGRVRMGHVARLTNAQAVIADAADADGIAGATGGLTVLDSKSLASCDPSDGDHRWDADRIALIAFTSGSTGVPKGVPLTAGNLWATPQSFGPEFGFAADEVCLNFTALDHVASLFGFCGSALLAGGQLALVTVETFLADPAALLHRFERWRVARSWAPDFAWSLLAAEAESLPGGTLDLSALRAVFSAGECGLDQTFARLAAGIARHGGQARLQTSWGMSETTSLLTLSAPWDGRGAHALRSGVIDNGGPVPGAAMRVVDEAGKPLPEGRIGRFEVRGPSVFGGYVTLGEPEIVHDSEGWMETGDLALIDDGRALICGREKEIMILNGQNVSQVEIEDRLNLLDGVAFSNTAVVACRDRRTGREAPVVFFSSDPPAMDPVDLVATIRRISGALTAGYGAVPAQILPLPPEEIPKTGLGKLQRTILRRRFEAGEFDGTARHVDLMIGGDRTTPNWFHRIDWKPRPLLPSGVRAVVLISPDGTLADAIEQRLHAAGMEVIRIALADDGSNDLESRLTETSASFRKPWTLIDLRPAEQPLAMAQAEPLHARLTAGLVPVADLLRTAKRLAAAGRAPAELLLVGRRGVETGSVHPANDYDAAFGAALWAAAENAALEIDGLDCRFLDLNGPDSNAEARAVTCVATGTVASGAAAIAWRDDGPLVPRLTEVNPHREPWAGSGARPEGTLALVGGLGQVGRALIPHLLVGTSWRLAVVGRRPPDRVAQEITRLAAATPDGADRLSYHQADILDEPRVGATLDALDGLFGLVHLAGVVDATPLDTVDAAALEILLRTRIEGAQILARRLEARGGGVLVHSNSVLGPLASRDHLGYGMASAAAQALACRAAGSSPGVRHVSLAFSQWQGGTTTDPLSDYLSARGFAAIDGEKGAAALIAAMGRRLPSLLVGLDPSAPMVGSRTERRPAPSESITFSGSAAQEAQRAAILAAAAALGLPASWVEAREGGASGALDALGAAERTVAAIWRELLGPDSTDNPDWNFFEVGGTSMLAAQLHERLQRSLGIGFDVVEIFARPTLRGIAARVAEEQSDRPPDASKPVPSAGASTAARQRAAHAQQRDRRRRGQSSTATIESDR